MFSSCNFYCKYIYSCIKLYLSSRYKLHMLLPRYIYKNRYIYYYKNILRSRGKVEEVLSRCVTVYYLALCPKLHSETTTRSDEHVTSQELHLHYLLQTAPLVVCFAHLPFVCRQLIELSMQQDIANFYSVWRRPQPRLNRAK